MLSKQATVIQVVMIADEIVEVLVGSKTYQHIICLHYTRYYFTVYVFCCLLTLHQITLHCLCFCCLFTLHQITLHYLCFCCLFTLHQMLLHCSCFLLFVYITPDITSLFMFSVVFFTFYQA